LVFGGGCSASTDADADGYAGGFSFPNADADSFCSVRLVG
jgi:hypothetical protein